MHSRDSGARGSGAGPVTHQPQESWEEASRAGCGAGRGAGAPGAWEQRGQVWKWVGGRGVEGGCLGLRPRTREGLEGGQGSRAQGSPEICRLRLGPGWSLRPREPSSGARRVSHARPLPQALKVPGPASPSPTRSRAPRATTQAPQAGGRPWPTRAWPPSPPLCHQLQQELPPGTGRPSLSLQRKSTIASWSE